MGPELSPETLRRIDILFPEENREARQDPCSTKKCGSNLPGVSQTDRSGL